MDEIARLNDRPDYSFGISLIGNYGVGLSSFSLFSFLFSLFSFLFSLFFSLTSVFLPFYLLI